MSDVKLPGVLAKVTGGPTEVQLPLPPGQAKKIDAPPPGDAFKGQNPLGGEVAQLTGQAVGLPHPAAALAVGARQIQNPAQALGQFHGAYAVIKDQLLDRPDLPRDELGQRANEFFTEYAKAFVQTATGEPPAPPEPQEQREASAPDRPEARPEAQAQTQAERPLSPEQQRALAREFADSLKMLGFEALKNEANGKDGVENAFTLLTAEGMKEFTTLAKEQKISMQGQFPPRAEGEPYDAVPGSPSQDGAPEARSPGDRLSTRDGDGDGGMATERSHDPDRLPGGQDEDEDIAKRRSKRSKNMLWSLLGTFRRQDENVRQAEEKWDRVVVAALLFLLLMALLTAALVSL